MEDYEELMLQISDVMREANRVRPDLSHEQAIKNIRGIVERHGKWEFVQYDANPNIGNWHCTNCRGIAKPTNFCPNCGARMDL